MVFSSALKLDVNSSLPLGPATSAMGHKPTKSKHQKPLVLAEAEASAEDGAPNPINMLLPPGRWPLPYPLAPSRVAG